ncbi:MAG: hypothetical protein HZA14_02350 [Nitrospirae bacterium]|nr:hypothetical protein [Nitrospirota bacterium]
MPALAGGATNTENISVTIPSGTCTGTYYLIARADGNNEISETSETNNTKNKTIKLTIDLTVSTLMAPTTGGAGQMITVTDTTKNSGGCTAGATTTKIYLSTNSAWDAGDTYLGERAIPSLMAGATNTGGTAVTIPSGTTGGTYYLIARADANNAVAESSETNNNKSKTIKIGPDLIVSSITAPASASQGATITITTTTKNNGAGAADESTTRLYLSTNTTYDAGDTELGSRAVPALAAGASNAGSASVTLPTGTTGAYYIIARADADAVVAETNETNNNKYKPITINP